MMKKHTLQEVALLTEHSGSRGVN